MNSNENKRITVLLKNPNPLFVKWLTDWKEEAKVKGSKMERVFNYALTNLRKYKIPLASGHECMILKGFSTKLCKMLDDKLTEHKMLQQNVPKNPKQSCSREYSPAYRSGGYAILMALYTSSLDKEKPEVLTKDEIIYLGKKYSNTSFIKPDPGSFYTCWSSMKTLIEKGLVSKQGRPIKYSLTNKGYSVAQTMSGIENIITQKQIETAPIKVTSVIDISNDSDDENFNENVSNEISDNLKSIEISPQNFELPSLEVLKMIISQPHVDELTVSNSSEHPISCSSRTSQKINQVKSMQTFVSLDSDVTSKKTSTNKTKGIKKYASSSSVQSTIQSSSQEECFIFQPNSFDVILYVDTQETSGSNTDIQDDPLLSKLQVNLVQYEVKHLSIGDYVWICRHRESKKELVLPYIIERKRLDDFASSIKDGRYYEQKFRLKKSGIQNVTYLIENFSKHVGLPLATLHQAAANTAIQDGFNVKFTANLRHTAKYLASFSVLLNENYKDKTIVSCPKESLCNVNITDDLVSLMTFNEFNKASSKHKQLKVSDLFIKMLLQLNGMSVEKACAIVEKYPTPSLLKNAYITYSQQQGEKLLANVTFGKYNKMIGAVLSKVVYNLFTRESF